MHIDTKKYLLYNFLVRCAMENLNKKIQCAFTGHRPGKINISQEEAKTRLRIAMRNAINAGYRIFITGMAPGFDIWAGEVVLEFKATDPTIRLVCALPYPTFYNNRNKSEKERYHSLLSQAGVTHISFPYYDPRCYQNRNIWMVDNSSLL